MNEQPINVSPSDPPYNIPHLAEEWCYGCNGTYSTGGLPLLHIPKKSRDFNTFSQKQQWVDHWYSTLQKHQFTFTIFPRKHHSVNVVGLDCDAM
jgi:hypothetical protein